MQDDFSALGNLRLCTAAAPRLGTSLGRSRRVVLIGVVFHVAPGSGRGRGAGRRLEGVPGERQVAQLKPVQLNEHSAQGLVVLEALGALPDSDEQGASQDVGRGVLERLAVLGLAGVPHHAGLALLHLAVAFLEVSLHVRVCGGTRER